MSETVVTLTVYLSPFVAAMAYGIWKAHRNGRTTKVRYRPPSHVRLIGQPCTPVEDLLRMSWWQVQADRLDPSGRPSKVGVDRHSRLCVDAEGHVLCVCGLDDRDVAGGAA